MCVCVQIQQYLDRNNQRQIDQVESHQLFKLQQSEKVRNTRLPSCVPFSFLLYISLTVFFLALFFVFCSISLP